MRLLSVLLTFIPMCVFTGAALWCIAHGSTGFAVMFTAATLLSVPSVSVGKRSSEGGAK